MKFLKIQLLYKFIQRLSKREKLIFYIAACLISLTLLDRLIISQIFYKMESLDKELKEKQSGIKKSLYLLSHKERIKAAVAQYSSFFGSAGSEEEEMTSILKEIENLANTNSVYLIDMKPGGLREAGEHKEFLIKLSCEAQISQITSFMYGVENSKKLFTISRYQISPKSKESSMARSSMTISRLVIP